jgi:hypothetical protein
MARGLTAGSSVNDHQRMSFQAKWSIGSVAFAAFLVAALVSHSPFLVALAGAGIAIFGLALSADYRGVATGLRRAQWRLGQSARTYRLVGRGFAVIGLIWLALALTRLL